MAHKRFGSGRRLWEATSGMAHEVSSCRETACQEKGTLSHFFMILRESMQESIFLEFLEETRDVRALKEVQL